jgi:hypothetical protein
MAFKRDMTNGIFSLAMTNSEFTTLVKASE